VDNVTANVVSIAVIISRKTSVFLRMNFSYETTLPKTNTLSEHARNPASTPIVMSRYKFECILVNFSKKIVCPLLHSLRFQNPCQSGNGARWIACAALRTQLLGGEVLVQQLDGDGAFADR